MQLFKNINFDKLKTGLSKTRDNLLKKINETFTGKAQVDEEVLEKLEEILITSDIGVNMTMSIIENVKVELKEKKERDVNTIYQLVKTHLINALSAPGVFKEYQPDIETKKPFVILIVGVNGVGKTTTIGKLAYNFRKSGLSVIVGAADTFRAAANEQLEIWAKRADVELISKFKGADPSSVAYETIDIAISKKKDVVLIDTAGRLHNKTNLMNELSKIRRVINKQLSHAPDEIWLVLDGNTGQNAIVQANEFSKATELTGIIVTKLDGTAKGGVVLNIVEKLNIPVRYVGVGEGIEDLQSFDPKSYVEALIT